MTLILALSCFATAVVSGIWGVGGGTILVIIMASFLPAKELIPIHGVLQLLSYGSTAAFKRRDIHWRILSRFSLGAVAGAATGALMATRVPDRALKLSMALIVLVSTWLPPLERVPRIRGKFVSVGFAGSFLAIFAGSVGPFMSPFFLRQRLEKKQLIATKAAAQVVLHFAKVVAFGVLGFNFGQHSQLTLTLAAATLGGSVVAHLFLARLPDRHFQLSLKILLSALAAKILWGLL